MTDQAINKAFGSIELPAGLERRLQEKIDAALETPMRQKKVILKPRKRLWKPALAAAAALVLLVLSILGLRSFRAGQERKAVLIPASQPGELEPGKAQTTETEADQIFSDDLYYRALYAGTLEKYTSALEGNLDAAACRELGISELIAGEEKKQNLGYTLEDLNGDGVPELLIGFVNEVRLDDGRLDLDRDDKAAVPESGGSKCLIDVYQLCGTFPALIAQSGEGVFWYDCGMGMLVRENIVEKRLQYLFCRMQEEPQKNGIYTLRLWMVSAYDESDGMRFYLDSFDPETLQIAASTEMTQEEGQLWLKEHFSSVTHLFTPFFSEAEYEPSEEEKQELGQSLEKQEGELVLILNEIGTKQAPFALTDYADGSPEGVVLLLAQMEGYASEKGLTPEQVRGLLYAREDLDAASAEAYAVLLGKLYPMDPGVFLQAWHDAGEPAELMHHVTGVTDPELSAQWLRERWRRSQKAKPSFRGLGRRAGETGFQSEADGGEVLELVLLKAEGESAEECFRVLVAPGKRSLFALCVDDRILCGLCTTAP